MIHRFSQCEADPSTAMQVSSPSDQQSVCVLVKMVSDRFGLVLLSELHPFVYGSGPEGERNKGGRRSMKRRGGGELSGGKEDKEE